MTGPTTGPAARAGGASRAPTPPPDPKELPTGRLIGDLTEQISTLVRDEVRLAQAEVTRKAKRLRVGAGLVGGAGVVALLGVGALITAAILGLATVIPGWLAAIVVAVVLFGVAAVLALLGKRDVGEATPPLPTEALAGVRRDVATVKEGIAR
jgi:Putative Actinobacterial Holin-X, holin superfamily III